ncbi:MAG: hypothetical protein D6698_10815 [Gammaproteobacteria bacterium]|nr:MAG: hypothetical protein D6698_10815 [Gammaproteobacteria bacterium]
MTDLANLHATPCFGVAASLMMALRTIACITAMIKVRILPADLGMTFDTVLTLGIDVAMRLPGRCMAIMTGMA